MSVALCNVDLHDGEYIVETYSQTVDGFWVGTGAFRRLGQQASAEELGRCVREALDRSEQGVPTPPADADPARPLLDALGYADYADYARGTRSVGVRATRTADGETVRVTPKKNGGPSRGFTPLKELAASFAFDSAERLGKEILAAFNHAR